MIIFTLFLSFKHIELIDKIFYPTFTPTKQYPKSKIYLEVGSVMRGGRQCCWCGRRGCGLRFCEVVVVRMVAFGWRWSTCGGCGGRRVKGRLMITMDWSVELSLMAVRRGRGFCSVNCWLVWKEEIL